MIGQLLTILKKDFRLLMRSKSSTLAVLFGPLLVVLLVGLVFTNAGDPELVVGVTSEDFENSDVYANSLAEAFTVIPYDDEQLCIQAVRQGTTVSCVSMEDGNPPKATIYVDPSDVNVVYAVIDRITGQIEEQTSVLRGGFANALLDSVTKANVKLRDDVEQLESARLILDQQQERTGELAGQLSGLELDVDVVSRRDVQEAIDLTVNAREEYRLLLLEALEGYDGVVDSNSTSEQENIDELYDLLNDLDDDVEDSADDAITNLLIGVEELNIEISETEEDARALASQATQIKNSIAIASTDVGQVLSSVRQSRDDLSGLDISRTDLTNPIRPVIEPVTTQDDSFGFVFPYFITLIVMFTAILLASTLIVRERQSSAFFRNFTTPTPEWLFVISNFLTTFIVLALQLAIILSVAGFFITSNLAGSLTTLLPILLLTVTFFSLLGMLVGYIFKSQEAVMLAAIAISSVLLFISDLVLPAETIPGVVQFIIGANPMVLSSQLMSASIVFGFGYADLATQLIVLGLYSIIMFIAIMIVQRLTRIRYFELAGAPERISAFLGKEEIPEGKELEIGEWVISSKQELLTALKVMEDEEYEQYASHKHNAVADWVLDVYKDERLSRQLRNKSRSGAIAVLEEEVK